MHLCNHYIDSVNHFGQNKKKNVYGGPPIVFRPTVSLKKRQLVVSDEDLVLCLWLEVAHLVQVFCREN